MDVLLKILLVACVCYSGVDARRGSSSRPQVDGDSAQVDAQEELMKCAMSMQLACAPILAELLPNGFEVTPVEAAESFKDRGIKDACRLLLQLEQCAMNTLNTKCSAAARQAILMEAPQQIAAARNALRYTCVQRINDFEELETCVKQKQQQGVNIEASVMARCPFDPATINGPGICGIDDQLKCPIGVLKRHCGKKGPNALKGLASRLLRDLGCEEAVSDTTGIQRAIDLLRRAFK